MRWVGLVMLIAWVSGCGTGPKSFGSQDPELQSAVRSAADRWAGATGWDVRVSSSPDVPVVWSDFDSGFAARHCLQPMTTNECKRAAADHGTDELIIVRSGTTSPLDIVITHEMGHAISLPNDRDQYHTRSGLMAPWAEGNPGCITGADVALICQGQCPRPRPECD